VQQIIHARERPEGAALTDGRGPLGLAAEEAYRDQLECRLNGLADRPDLREVHAIDFQMRSSNADRREMAVEAPSRATFGEALCPN
jgi:hypothetical protein